MAGTEPQGTHFFLIVIQAPQPNGGYSLAHANGTWTPRRGQSRYDVLNDIRAQLEQQHPLCRGGAVVTFDIQPNKL